VIVNIAAWYYIVNGALAGAPRLLGLPIVFNLPAVLIVALITWILVRGIRESAGFNSAMVLLKLAIIGFFIAVGACYVKPENWTPFAPNGFAGISSAAAIIFTTSARRRFHGGGGRRNHSDMPRHRCETDSMHNHLCGGARVDGHGEVWTNSALGDPSPAFTDRV
jgi:hypothetical protein